MPPLTDYEKETIILFNEEENYVKIYTHNPNMKNMLAKYARKCPDKFHLLYTHGSAKSYKVLKSAVSVTFSI